MSEPQGPQHPVSPETQMAPQQPPAPQWGNQPGAPTPSYPAAPGYPAAQQPYPPEQPYPPQPGYPVPAGYAVPPVQPSYPPQFPGLPPGSGVPAPPAGSNFSSGKAKTIGLIVAGVLAVGAVGGISAAAFGGGDGDDQRSSTVSKQNSGILNPEPVGSAAPVPSPPTQPSEPPPTPTAPTPSPEPPPASPPADGGGAFVTLSGSGVQVYVPSGWESDPGEFAIELKDGTGAYGYVLTGAGDAALEATALISQNIDTLLPSSTYTYELSGAEPLNPFGSVVSLASVEYNGTIIDSQSPLPALGKIFGAVRSDGTVLLILIEQGTPESYSASNDDFSVLVNETLNTLGGS